MRIHTYSAQVMTDIMKLFIVILHTRWSEENTFYKTSRCISDRYGSYFLYSTDNRGKKAESVLLNWSHLWHIGSHKRRAAQGHILRRNFRFDIPDEAWYMKCSRINHLICDQIHHRQGWALSFLPALPVPGDLHFWPWFRLCCWWT